MGMKSMIGVYQWGDCANPAVYSKNHIDRMQYIIDNFYREESIGEYAEEIEGATPEVLEILKKVDNKRIYNHLLTHFLSLTDSSFGFIGKIRIDEAGNKFLLTDAISNIAWDAASKAFFLEHALKGMEFKNPNSLFGHVIGSGELVISNDPKSDPKAGGTPGGHPPLKCFIGIPFFHDGNMIGMVGLANRSGGYQVADYEALEDLIRFSADTMHHY
jgi:GAF domain-containing protein